MKFPLRHLDMQRVHGKPGFSRKQIPTLPWNSSRQHITEFNFFFKKLKTEFENRFALFEYRSCVLCCTSARCGAGVRSRWPARFFIRRYRYELKLLLSDVRNWYFHQCDWWQRISELWGWDWTSVFWHVFMAFCVRQRQPYGNCGQLTDTPALCQRTSWRHCCIHCIRYKCRSKGVPSV